MRPRSGKWCAGLEVGVDQLHPRVVGEVGDAREVAIDGDDRVTLGEEEPRVPSTATGDVEHGAAGRYARGEALDPRRRAHRLHAHRVGFGRAGRVVGLTAPAPHPHPGVGAAAHQPSTATAANTTRLTSAGTRKRTIP